MTTAPRRLLDSSPDTDDVLTRAMHATRVTEATPEQLAHLQTRVLAALASTARTPAPRNTWPRRRYWISGGVLLLGTLSWLGAQLTPRASQAPVATEPEHRAAAVAAVGADGVTPATHAPPTPAPALAPVAHEVATHRPAKPRPTDAGAPVGTELELLQAAEAELVPDPQASLRLTEQHLRAYPEGLLAQERELLAVQALLHLGERVQAEQRADAFSQRYPQSPLKRRLSRVLGRVNSFENAADASTSTPSEVTP